MTRSGELGFATLISGLLLLFLPVASFAKGLTDLQTEAQKDAEDSETDNGTQGIESDRESDAVRSVTVAPIPSGPSQGLFFAGINLASTKVGSSSTHALAVGEAGLAAKGIELGSVGGVWASFRYAAHEFDAIQDDISYRGVAEVFAVGGLFRSQAVNSVEFYGGFEAGFAKVGVRDLTGIGRQSDLAGNGVYGGLVGGLDWIYVERTTLGPKLVAGFGRIRTFGVGVTSSFLF